jgi:hypothetical protein
MSTERVQDEYRKEQELKTKIQMSCLETGLHPKKEKSKKSDKKLKTLLLNIRCAVLSAIS